MDKSVFPLERKMVSLRRETFYLVERKTYKLLATVQGNYDSITIPVNLLPKTKDNITIHNHPRFKEDGEARGGWGFSPDDLAVAVTNNVFQSRVVGWDYYKDSPCVYVITRNGSVWRMSMEESAVALDHKIDEITPLAGRKISVVEATFRVYHEWMDELSVQENFYYDILHF